MEALIPITFFLSVAAVMILRPVTKKLGGFLDALTRERIQPAALERTDSRVVALLEHMSKRLDVMEERLDFTERLVSAPQRRAVRHETADFERV